MLPRDSQSISVVCTCGRHRCAFQPIKGVREGPCPLSEYSQEYTPHPAQPVGSCKPAAKAVASDGPLSDQTTNRVDFISHPLEKPHVHQGEQYKAPEGEFDGTTMYNKEYTEKKGSRAKPVKREVKRGVAGEFKGEPTYTQDYKAWKVAPPTRTNVNPQWQQPKDPFSGVPLYQTDYVPHQMQPTTSCKPNETAKQSNAPLDSDTDYRLSYIQHPLERRQEKEKATWAKPSAPFEGLTTFNKDYTPKGAALRASMKPTGQAYASNAPFQSDTTNRADFIAQQLQKPHVHQADAYVAPQGEMDDTTTYYKDYPAHPLVKESYSKRPERGLPSGPFQGNTDYQDNYKGWKPTARSLAGPNQTYQPNAAPFEGQSTTSAHYTAHQVDPRSSFKPNNNAARNDGPFDGTTLYRMEYVPKHLDPCPVTVMEAKSSRYKFHSVDEKGQLWYVPKGMPAVDDNGKCRMVTVN